MSQLRRVTVAGLARAGNRVHPLHREQLISLGVTDTDTGAVLDRAMVEPRSLSDLRALSIWCNIVLRALTGYGGERHKKGRIKADSSPGIRVDLPVLKTSRPGIMGLGQVTTEVTSPQRESAL
jgi:hypothetical protein